MLRSVSHGQDVEAILWKDEDDIGQGPIGPVWYRLMDGQIVKDDRWFLRSTVIEFCEENEISYEEA